MKFLFYRDKIISLSKCSFHIAAPFLVKNHYETLGVKETATINEIKSAYYQLSMQYHPDKNKDSKEAAEKFRDISEAYEILGNLNKKKLYDRGLVPDNVRQWKPPKSNIYRPRSTFSTEVDQTIYNFDAWSRAHYGQTFRRKAKEKAKYEEHKIKIEKKELNFEISLTASLILLLVLGQYLINQGYDEIKTKKVINKDSESIKKD